MPTQPSALPSPSKGISNELAERLNRRLKLNNEGARSFVAAPNNLSQSSHASLSSISDDQYPRNQKTFRSGWDKTPEFKAPLQCVFQGGANPGPRKIPPPVSSSLKCDGNTSPRLDAVASERWINNSAGGSIIDTWTKKT